ncbi:MAG: hypothetical protein O9305_19880, partial [Rhodobacteraceae bacterium]|nr:hypothetical protein [Paracoccaceae bacterium]
MAVSELWTNVSSRALRLCGRANGQSWTDQALSTHLPGFATTLFSTSDGAVLALSFGLVRDRGHVDDGGARGGRIAANMSRTIGPVTA